MWKCLIAFLMLKVLDVLATVSAALPIVPLLGRPVLASDPVFPPKPSSAPSSLTSAQDLPEETVCVCVVITETMGGPSRHPKGVA